MNQRLYVGCLCVWVGIVWFLGCGQLTTVRRNEPLEKEQTPLQPLPPEKEALTAYHPVEFLTTELASAPFLTEKNHRHGWKQTNCVQCHRTPAASKAPSVCFTCHGHNGVGDRVDNCTSCHRATHPTGAPPTGQHLAHVESGPQDRQCLMCHPGYKAKTHANGMVNIQFREGGTYTTDSEEQEGLCAIACHEPRRWRGEGCDKCHRSPPVSGKHPIHLSQTDMTCRDCHKDHQHDDNMSDGVIETGGVTYNAITGGCNAVCHETQQNWECTGCHGYPPTSGSHDPAIHSFACNTCHQGHDHSYQAAMNPLDFSNVSVNLMLGGSYEDTTADGTANGTCSETTCHGPREWGTDCSACHHHPPTSGKHQLHVVEVEATCEDCHQQNQHDMDATSGTIELGGVDYDRQKGSCNAVCHEKTQQWDCAECHGYPPSSANHEVHTRKNITCAACHADHTHSYKMAVTPLDFSETHVQIPDGGVFDAGSKLCSTSCHEPRVWGSTCADCHGNPPPTGRHELHLLVEGVTCGDCHAGRDHDLEVTSGVIDVGGVKYNSLTGACASVCHDEEVRWDCNSCHGYPPETGSHRKHAADLQLGCHLCHQGHQHSYRGTDPALRDFSPVEIGFTVRGSWDGHTCANIGCHANRTWEAP